MPVTPYFYVAVEKENHNKNAWHNLGQYLYWRLFRLPSWVRTLFWRLWVGHAFKVFRPDKVLAAVSNGISPLFEDGIGET